MIKAKIPTLSEFIPEYIAHMREVKQKRSWKRDKELLEPLCRMFGNKKLSDITVRPGGFQGCQTSRGKTRYCQPFALGSKAFAEPC